MPSAWSSCNRLSMGSWTQAGCSTTAYVVVGADSGCRGLCNRLLRRFRVVCGVVSLFGVDFDLGPGPNLVLDIDNFEIDEPAEHAITRPAQYG